MKNWAVDLSIVTPGNANMTKKYRIKLCQFKHKEETNGEKENLTENIANDIDKITDIEDEVSKKEKFENMNEYNQFEVYQEICLNICWAGDHKCMDHIEDNALLGVNVDKIRDDYNNRREEIFYCERCDCKSKGMENVRKHFLAKHKDNNWLKCWVCDKEMENISAYKKHYATNHYTPAEPVQN